MSVMGLDLSLTASGVVVLDNNGKFIEKATIKSKPMGVNPIHELIRINGIVAEILKYISKYEPEMVVIEQISFGSKGPSLSQLTYLNYSVRDVCRQYKIPFALCAVTSNKKYCSGSGKAEKDMMTMYVLKKWGIECANNNESDAFSLAHVAFSLLGYNKNMLEYEKEVVELLKKQL